MVDRNGHRDLVLEHVRAGALETHVDLFASFLAKRGYSQWTIRYAARLAAELGRWLVRRRRGAESLGERDIAGFLQWRWKRRRRHREDSPCLRYLLQCLRDLGVIPQPVAPSATNKMDRIVPAYAAYLRRERGLAEPTVANYGSLIDVFLRSDCVRRRSEPKFIRASDVHEFVLRYVRSGSRGRAKLMVTALRSFFRFLQLRGDIDVDLAACVLSVAGWRLTTLPQSVSAHEVHLILRTCDRRTAKGSRDYAILLLLARLGLRSREIRGLTLEDLDWDRGELVVRGKLGRVDRLPMPRDVGEALARYLSRHRPVCAMRSVFLRVRAPRCSIGSAALSTIVFRAVACAGLDPPQSGAYLLRHSLATNMLRQGASLAEIGELLRHQLKTTTQIYAKHDLDGLRMVAHPWPGGRR